MHGWVKCVLLGVGWLLVAPACSHDLGFLSARDAQASDAPQRDAPQRDAPREATLADKSSLPDRPALSEEAAAGCDDGTPDGECSKDKPGYLCESGAWRVACNCCTSDAECINVTTFTCQVTRELPSVNDACIESNAQDDCTKYREKGAPAYRWDTATNDGMALFDFAVPKKIPEPATIETATLIMTVNGWDLPENGKFVPVRLRTIGAPWNEDLVDYQNYEQNLRLGALSTAVVFDNGQNTLEVRDIVQACYTSACQGFFFSIEKGVYHTMVNLATKEDAFNQPLLKVVYTISEK